MSPSKTLLLSSLFCAGICWHEPLVARELCAYRDGPRGPCTCRAEHGGPGDFVVVNKRFCAKAAPAKASEPATPPATTADVQQAPAAAATGVLDGIRQRGKIRCGVNSDLKGFSAKSDTGEWVGLDADFCRAVSAAVFGSATNVEFLPVETTDRFTLLQNGTIDLLARNTTWTMQRDVDLGFDFAGVLYYDGQGFLTKDDRGLVSAQQLAGLKICVEKGTTTESNMAYYFKSHEISIETIAVPGRKELLDGYLNGQCDAYSGDRSALFSDRISMQNPGEHAILPEVISKEPLGPAVVDNDKAWSDVVKWTLAGLINAEEIGLTRAIASGSEPLKDDHARLIGGAGSSGAKLGLAPDWLRNAVRAVGNYGEMFDANLGKNSPIGMDRGINALWKRGGLQFAPPMW